jgi:hypothetical protein
MNVVSVIESTIVSSRCLNRSRRHGSWRFHRPRLLGARRLLTGFDSRRGAGLRSRRFGLSRRFAARLSALCRSPARGLRRRISATVIFLLRGGWRRRQGKRREQCC